MYLQLHLLLLPMVLVKAISIDALDILGLICIAVLQAMAIAHQRLDGVCNTDIPDKLRACFC